jgi:hypothetical protein
VPGGPGQGPGIGPGRRLAAARGAGGCLGVAPGRRSRHACHARLPPSRDPEWFVRLSWRIGLVRSFGATGIAPILRESPILRTTGTGGAGGRTRDLMARQLAQSPDHVTHQPRECGECGPVCRKPRTGASWVGCVCPKPRSAGPVCHEPRTAARPGWGACAPSPVVRVCGACVPRAPNGRASWVGCVCPKPRSAGVVRGPCATSPEPARLPGHDLSLVQRPINHDRASARRPNSVIADITGASRPTPAEVLMTPPSSFLDKNDSFNRL